MPERFSPVGQQLLRPTRRQLLKATGLTPGAVLASQAVATPAQALTTRLHEDTAEAGEAGYIYTGTPDAFAGDGGHTADDACIRGPGLISAYAGGLYVRSNSNKTLRSGPAYPRVFGYPGVGNPGAMRWASHRSFTPEYRFTGRLMVLGIAERPYAYVGLVFHPIHISDFDNYNIVIWRRDGEWLSFGREVNDTTTLIGTWDFPHPKLDTWYEYRIDVLPNSRIRFYWDGELVFDMDDPMHSFTAGPVGDAPGLLRRCPRRHPGVPAGRVDLARARGSLPDHVRRAAAARRERVGRPR